MDHERPAADTTADTGGLPPDELLADVLRYPLFGALMGRRARRFAMGASIPDGPVAHESDADPLPLTELEQALVISAAVGTAGWHFGVPYTAAVDGLCTYSARFTGRPTPTAAGIGTVELFYTDDDGTYFVGTRDETPPDGGEPVDDAAALVARHHDRTTRLGDERLTLPREAPHVSPHNRWNANVAGSTLVIPVADVAQQLLGFLLPWAQQGVTLYDDQRGRFAGDLGPYFESGVLDGDSRVPLTELEQYVFATNAVELGIMSHNMVLTLQAMGLGGWLFTGMSPLSLLGAHAESGIPGLGFEFQRDESWTVPNPVGLPGVYEAFVPPFYPDMHAAVEAFVALKFGDGGAYDTDEPGPYHDAVRSTATPYSPELVEAVGTMAQYVLDTYGRFPATVPTVFVRPLVQVHHLDTDYYDEHLGPDSYLETHATHLERWHGIG